jgi:hypothetical protein
MRVKRHLLSMSEGRKSRAMLAKSKAEGWKSMVPQIQKLTLDTRRSTFDGLLTSFGLAR